MKQKCWRLDRSDLPDRFYLYRKWFIGWIFQKQVSSLEEAQKLIRKRQLPKTLYLDKAGNLIY